MKGLYFIWFLDKEKQTSRRESKRKKKKKEQTMDWLTTNNQNPSIKPSNRCRQNGAFQNVIIICVTYMGLHHDWSSAVFLKVCYCMIYNEPMFIDSI